MIVSMQKILAAANKGKFAVGAFNTSNLEITLAIIRAAVKQKSPVIIQTSESAVKYSNLPTIYNLIKTLANTVGRTVPVAIHLDHGKDLGLIKECIQIGYNSVHVDKSLLDFQTNIRLTRQIVKLAHARQVAVQSELGTILGKEGLVKLKQGKIKMSEFLTNPTEAQVFAKKTGIDTLAVAVGTIHGSFRGVEKVDQERLQKIHKLVKVPLVLHGGSGLPDQVYRQAIKNGVRIINIDTNLRLVWKKAMKKSLAAKQDLIDPRQLLSLGTEAMQREAEERMRVFGSAGKARLL